MRKNILTVWIKPWSEDRWFSMIDNPVRHPDKAGHFVAHFAATVLFFWITGVLWFAFLWDLWFNTQVEIMDGTRPRGKLYGLPLTVFTQPDYEAITVEGFSLKDWLAGLAGSLLFCVWRLYV